MKTEDKPAVKAKFIEMLRGPAAGQPLMACRYSGLSKTSAYRERQNDPEFKKAWDEAVAVGAPEKIKVLEASAFERAVYGYAKPVYRPTYKWDEENPELLERSRTDPMAALALSKLTKNIIGYEHVPPSDRLMELLLKAENAKKYNPPRTNVTVNTDGDASLVAEIKEVCAQNDIPFKEQDFHRFLRDMAREYMQKQSVVDAESDTVS